MFESQNLYFKFKGSGGNPNRVKNAVGTSYEGYMLFRSSSLHYDYVLVWLNFINGNRMDIAVLSKSDGVTVGDRNNQGTLNLTDSGGSNQFDAYAIRLLTT